jgi:hypothetical protein
VGQAYFKEIFMTGINQDVHFNAEEVATIEWMTDYVIKRGGQTSHNGEGRFSSQMRTGILRSRTREAVVECLRDRHSMQKVKRLRQHHEYGVSELERIFGLER